MQVTGAHMENGLLVIDLKREIPEAYKLRRVEIGEAVATTATPAAESIQSQAA